MYGPRLNKLLNLKNSMPSEAFYKLLARKNATSNNVVEAGSGSGAVSEAVAGYVGNVAG